MKHAVYTNAMEQRDYDDYYGDDCECPKCGSEIIKDRGSWHCTECDWYADNEPDCDDYDAPEPDCWAHGMDA